MLFIVYTHLQWAFDLRGGESWRTKGDTTGEEDLIAGAKVVAQSRVPSMFETFGDKCDSFQIKLPQLPRGSGKKKLS